MNKIQREATAVRINQYLEGHGFKYVNNIGRSRYSKGCIDFNVFHGWTWEFAFNWQKLIENTPLTNTLGPNDVWTFKLDIDLISSGVDMPFNLSAKTKKVIKTFPLDVYLQVLEMIKHREVLQKIGKTDYSE